MLTMTILVLADLCASQRAVLAAMPVVRRTMPGEGEASLANVETRSPVAGPSSPLLPGDSGLARAEGVAK